ncbi:MAG: adenosylcobalamin-dependent ribonucleoside-diphosphate reductase [Synergistales bacterium]|nr:adenosylcobalamin-dependent ribonucleoside-diphosphate reductase [Synergistales bacterium]
MIKRFRERFDPQVDMHTLENPSEYRLSENARWLLSQRYFADVYDASTGEIRKEKSFEEFARRVARTIASAETNYLDKDDPKALSWLITLETNIFNDILNRRFLFNSPCLFGSAAGLTNQPEMAEKIYCSPDNMTFEDYECIFSSKTSNQQLFACFVIDIPDSIDGIFDSVKDAATISKFGGGVGGNFGNLRESGSDIDHGTGGQASGPVSFMETWNTMGSVVVQGGRRRAALMGMLFDDHPDIEKFIDAKVEDGKLSYFNISVCVSDALIESAEKNKDFPLISRYDGSVLRTVKARDLWEKLCGSAWQRGDPGVFFIDRANADNILKMDEQWRIDSTNPCGEQPLPNYTSCNLGSINLEAFVEPDEEGLLHFDMEDFIDQVFRSMYYLDLVIDACSYPLAKIESRTKKIRPVGLGLMGLADAALLLGMRYGSDEFNDFCRIIGDKMAAGALAATMGITSEMSKEAFPESHLVGSLFQRFREEFGDGEFLSEEWIEAMDEETFGSLVKRMRMSETIPYTLVNTLEALLSFSGSPDKGLALSKQVISALIKGQLRNSRRLSVAPTGSISMLLDASPGIEPNFAWSWTRKISSSNGEGFEVREFFHKLVTDQQKQELHASGKLSDPVYVTAHDIPPREHVEVTGIFSQVVDSGISKTVNLPNSATVDDVKTVYEMCYKQGAKGITIYRDGSRSYQPIEVKKAETAVEHTSQVKERSKLVVFGKTIKETTPWGSIYVTLNFDGNDPFEVFANIGKSGSEMTAMTEALSRVISIGLRSGGKIEDFIATLRGISGKEYWMFQCDEKHVVRSIPDALAMLLEKLMGHEKDGEEDHQKICPECGSPMEMISGCAYCFSCGYSPCK